VKQELIIKRMDYNNILDIMSKNAFLRKEVELCDLVQDFYRIGLSCSVFPEPKDKDKNNLAMKAAIIERMAQVFTIPPHKRKYEIPDWCKNDWRCTSKIYLISKELLSLDEPNEIFQKRNIFTLKNFLYFV